MVIKLGNKEFCDDLVNDAVCGEENIAQLSENQLAKPIDDTNENISFSDVEQSTQKYEAGKTGGELTDKQLILNMQAQIEELTQEVKKLREQVDQNESAFTTESEKENLQNNGKEKKKKNIYAVFGEILFYSMLVLLVLGAFFIRSNSNGKPNSIAGFSAFTVLTSSMESEIPKGSLVITQSVDPNTLKIGDDITYMSGPTSTITHRIIGITENYLDTGQRGFETKGIMNAEPDKDIVPSANVVGKVIFHNKFLGDVSTYITKNWPIVIFVFVVIIVLFIVLKKVLSDDSDNKEKNKKKETDTENVKT